MNVATDVPSATTGNASTSYQEITSPISDGDNDVIPDTPVNPDPSPMNEEAEIMEAVVGPSKIVIPMFRNVAELVITKDPVISTFPINLDVVEPEINKAEAVIFDAVIFRNVTSSVFLNCNEEETSDGFPVMFAYATLLANDAVWDNVTYDAVSERFERDDEIE